MSCAKYKNRLLEFALDAERGDAELSTHLDHCADCRAEFESNRTIAAAMNRALADELSEEPSPAFAAHVRRRISEDGERRGAGWPAWAPAAAGFALVALVVVWIAFLPERRQLPVEVVGRQGTPEAKTLPPAKGEAPSEKPVETVAPSGKGVDVSSPKVRAVATVREPEVLVPPGQMAAVWQLYDAVWSGRVTGNPAPAAAQNPNGTLPPLKLPPLEFPVMAATESEGGERNESPGRR